MNEQKKNFINVYIPKFRVSYPKLDAPEGYKGGPEKYSCTFLIPKEDEKTMAKIDAVVSQLCKSFNKGRKLDPSKNCVKDGDFKDKDGYEGHFYITAKNKDRPRVLNRAKREVRKGENQFPDAGDYCDGIVCLYFSTEFGNINAILDTVRFQEEGEKFGSGQASLDEMPDLDDENFDEDGLD